VNMVINQGSIKGKAFDMLSDLFSQERLCSMELGN
jgi:hypothetical protein